MTSYSLAVESFQDHVRFLSPFKGRDKVALFVIKGQIWQTVYLVERRQNELFIAADLHIRMLIHFVVRIEILHLFEGLIGGHHDIHILERIPVGQDRFRLMFAMLAIRTKEHHDGLPPLFQIRRRQIGAAVQPQQMEGWDRREFHERRLRVGRISSRLIGKLGLGGKDMTKGGGN